MATISILMLESLQRLSDRQLQTDYLNYPDRTPEIMNLLSQMSDRILIWVNCS
jgi:hypothetical protein